MTRAAPPGVPLALTTPCAGCPFLRTRPGFLTRTRARVIADATFREGRPFNCHKTIRFDGDTGEGVVTPASQNCAGALILAERVGRRGQIAQIAERLGLWSPSSLDAGAPVYDTVEEFVAAQGDGRDEPGGTG